MTTHNDPAHPPRPAIVQMLAACAWAALALGGCGSGGGGDAIGGADTASQPVVVTPPPSLAPAPPALPPAPAPAVPPPVAPPPVEPPVVTPPIVTPPDDCALPALPTKPLLTVDVRSFGAIPDDGLDDTRAIQSALDALQPGQWLVFPAGTYLHRTRLNVRTPRAVLWSEGATLHATNPDDQAVMLSADGASIYNFTLTAVTRSRLMAPWQARIAVFERVDRVLPLRDVVVRGNRVVAAGAPGSPTANSASSAGIYVEYADNFLVAGNEVQRSLADGIQVVGGSRNGRVLFNTVRESGDDMIGVVSYLGNTDWTAESAASIAANFEARRDRQLVRNVLVAHNDLGGQYWGRGISVVGGADITVRANRIARTTVAAGILVAREASYVTWGVNNVLVQDNAVSQVQTVAASYTPVGWNAAQPLTGHGGVEIHAFVFDDERAHPRLLEALTVQNVRVARTTISEARAAGVRVGAGTGLASTLSGLRPDGQPISRGLSGGLVRRIDLSTIDMAGTAEPALDIHARTTPADNVFCEGLMSNGRAALHGACGGTRPVVTGAAFSCRG